jgi:hypothetical protein
MTVRNRAEITVKITDDNSRKAAPEQMAPEAPSGAKTTQQGWVIGNMTPSALVARKPIYSPNPITGNVRDLLD